MPILERRLTTIVAADIASFSRLVHADEEGTLSAQRAHRAELIDPLIARYRGRVANTAGDSLLIEFPSAVQAVRCACAVQEGMTARNADVPDGRRIFYRIGINVGDVVPDGDDLLGDGVNVAARLEALATPGAILLSRSARDQVRDKMDIALADMGEVDVKNIERPVRVFKIGGHVPESHPAKSSRPKRLILAAIGAVLLVTAVGLWSTQRTEFEPVPATEMALELPSGPSIAVMPFAYIGAGDDENSYLAEGISENIITNLAKLPNLLVIAKSSSFSYKGEEFDVREVARRFGVRYILEGSVQKSSDQLRITAQLLDVVEGKHLWSDTFDRQTGDFFDIQDEITLAILERVHGDTIDGARVTLRETDSLEAFAESAKGREYRARFTAEDNKTARKHYEAALRHDPAYLDALIGIGFTHAMDVRLGFSENRNASLALAEEYIARALEIQPDHPAALSNLAVLRIVQKRGDEAREIVLRAIEGGSGDVRVIRGAAWVLKYSGASRDSLQYFARAKRMMPVQTWWLIADEFGALMDAGEYEAAYSTIDAYLAVAPSIYRAEFLVFAAVAARHVEDIDGASAFIAEARKLKPGIAISNIRPFDLAYIDPAIPERRYVVMRDLGLPD